MTQIGYSIPLSDIPHRAAVPATKSQADGRFAALVEDLNRAESREAPAGRPAETEAAAPDPAETKKPDAEPDPGARPADDAETGDGAAEDDASSETAQSVDSDAADHDSSEFEDDAIAQILAALTAADDVLAAATANAHVAEGERAAGAEGELSGFASRATDPAKGPASADQSAEPIARGSDRASASPLAMAAAMSGPTQDIVAGAARATGEAGRGDAAPPLAPVSEARASDMSARPASPEAGQAEIVVRRAPETAQIAQIASAPSAIGPAIAARLAVQDGGGAPASGRAAGDTVAIAPGDQAPIDGSQTRFLGDRNVAGAPASGQNAPPMPAAAAMPQAAASAPFAATLDAAATSGVDGPASAEPAFGGDAGSSRATGPAVQIAPAGIAMERPTPQISQIAEAVRGRQNGLVEVSLSPEELGRVKIALHRTDSGIQIVVMADRDDTMSLLRRNGDMLETAFRELDMGEVDISFGRNDRGQSRAVENAGPGEAEPIAGPAAIETATTEPIRTRTGLDRLDMKI